MKVKFADSFWESLDRITERERWYWKAWDFLRYDIPKGIKNIIFFWKVIWNFRSWDYTYNLRIFSKSLEALRDSLKDGNEINSTRLKKVEKIERAIEILNNICEDRYSEIAESQLGYEMNFDHLFTDDEPKEITEANKKIRDLSIKIEDNEWKELWNIFQGQENSHYIMLVEKMEKDEKKNRDIWSDWYDGTGINRWWN
jgi:hypothetical protein